MPKHSNHKEIAKIPMHEFHDTGVNSFFRVISANLNNQNMLADRKANILISINTVALSLLIGSSARNIDNWKNLFLPTIVLVCTLLVTTVLAVWATRPNIRKGNISQEDLDNKKSNLLFFGNFTNLSLEDFEDAMLTVLKEDQYLFRTILADCYGQGKVLNRKYLLLKYAYDIFLVGMILSVILFVVFLKLDIRLA